MSGEWMTNRGLVELRARARIISDERYIPRLRPHNFKLAMNPYGTNPAESWHDLI